MKSAPSAVLQIRDLTFHYPGRALFNHWSADIPSGITVVRGGDGCGKSSLLQLMAGVLPAQAGQFRIQGVLLSEQPDEYRRKIFWIDPRTDAFDQMTAIEYFASLRAAYPAFDDTLLPGLTEGLSLTPHVHKQLYMLSTGSKRKVWLAAAFAANASLNLLDDPYAGLDRASINFVEKTLSQIGGDPARAWILALYETPPSLPLPFVVDLGD
ncbi:ABC transporter ATP-binding protein [Undibacterium sp. TJN25]|uniref:ABC transporter ATP-binding protein n=1 Tax=Undibacterium sp. TJN25 TaxID=3413056 RepID=UPI003BEF6F67